MAGFDESVWDRVGEEFDPANCCCCVGHRHVSWWLLCCVEGDLNFRCILCFWKIIYLLLKTNFHVFCDFKCFFNLYSMNFWNQTGVLHWNFISLFVKVLSVPFNHEHRDDRTVVHRNVTKWLPSKRRTQVWRVLFLRAVFYTVSRVFKSINRLSGLLQNLIWRWIAAPWCPQPCGTIAQLWQWMGTRTPAALHRAPLSSAGGKSTWPRTITWGQWHSSLTRVSHDSITGG